MEFKRVIEVTKETRDFLQQAFDVTGTMVWYALNFDEKRGQSDLAKRIRNLALQKGGVVLNIGPEIETIHSADGRMRQYFPHDVLLEADTRCTGLVAVYKKGELQRSWDNPGVSELDGIQNWAMSL
ncbi:hypothetical protein [Segatella oris]|jgi:hypothetical protein|uniref:Uncharacterized protein n=1 Tax=Segatella oris C735 TaxID=563008 RepID=D7NE18_9BACT|nr:hypothetical protein [Segatella oris]EFI48165.1 conserved hypothetical protein [Segatella oris C735]DAY20417.1 MAG TPA: hypothetical protein [Caudoviricetes sp.]